MTLPLSFFAYIYKIEVKLVKILENLDNILRNFAHHSQNIKTRQVPVNNKNQKKSLISIFYAGRAFSGYHSELSTMVISLGRN